VWAPPRLRGDFIRCPWNDHTSLQACNGLGSAFPAALVETKPRRQTNYKCIQALDVALSKLANQTFLAIEKFFFAAHVGEVQGDRIPAMPDCTALPPAPWCHHPRDRPGDGEVTVVTDETLGEKDPLLVELLAAWSELLRRMLGQLHPCKSVFDLVSEAYRALHPRTPIVALILHIQI
jgi:hypothetical protein